MVDFVTVHCNLPMGVRLRLHTIGEESEPAGGGTTRQFKIARPTGDEVVLNGTSAQHGQARKDRNGDFVLMVSGFAATPDVSKDFWDAWVAQNAGHPMLTSNPPGVFARGKAADAQAQAKGYAGARSGLEPLVQTVQDGAGRVTQRDLRAPNSVVRHDGERAA